MYLFFNVYLHLLEHDQNHFDVFSPFSLSHLCTFAASRTAAQLSPQSSRRLGGGRCVRTAPTAASPKRLVTTCACTSGCPAALKRHKATPELHCGGADDKIGVPHTS